MSAEEFDADIERLFARSPSFPDAESFGRAVDARLQRGGRVRLTAMIASGTVGAVVALRETLKLDVGAVAQGDGVMTGRALSHGVQNASVELHGLAQTGLDRIGLASIDLTAVSGMQLFWAAAALLVVGATAAVMRLSSEV